MYEYLILQEMTVTKKARIQRYIHVLLSTKSVEMQLLKCDEPLKNLAKPKPDLHNILLHNYLFHSIPIFLEFLHLISPYNCLSFIPLETFIFLWVFSIS